MRRVPAFMLTIFLLITCVVIPAVRGSNTQENAQEVVQLLDILRRVDLQNNEPERVIDAILRLKEIRSELAIDELANLITFRRRFPFESPDGVIGKTLPIFQRYPATEALVAIGEPALPKLVNIIEENEISSKASHNALHTLLRIFQYKPIAIKYLRDAALKVSSDPEKLSHLNGTIDDAEKFLTVVNDGSSETGL